MNIATRLLAAALILSPAFAFAQTWPSRPVRFVVGFPAGGGSDVLARKLAERVSPRLGQPVIVENKPGAGAAIAAQSVIQADPDGYTLYSAGGSMAAFKVFNTDLTFDVRRDLAPIGKFADGIGVLIVNTKYPWKNLKEFIDYAKANPGKLNFGTPGGAQRLAMERLRVIAGIDMLQVQYKGSADYSAALLADQVQLIIDSPATHLGNVEVGKVRYLAVTRSSRVPGLPNVPTPEESGLPGWSWVNWSALLGPAKLPRPIIDRMNREVTAVVNSEEFKEDTLKWSKGGYVPISSTPEELGAMIASEMKNWEDIASKIKLD